MLLSLSFVAIFQLLSLQPLWAVTKTASATGNWSNTNTWGGSAIPTAADDVVINAGVTVTNNLSAVCTNLTINGTLTNSGTNTITLSGNWVNNGTFNAATGTVAFNGTAKTLGGTSTTSFNNLTLGTGSGQSYSLANQETVNGLLSLQNNSLLTIGSYNLIVGTSGTITGNFWAGCMIVADGTGQLQKMINVNGSFVFPIGDVTNGADYSPITLNFTSGTYAGGAWVGVNVRNVKHPQNASPSNYLKRYWSVSQSGISAFSCNVSGTYVYGSDVVGYEYLMNNVEYTGASWQNFGSLSGGNVTANNVTVMGDFTAMGLPSFTTGSALSAFTYVHGAGPSLVQSFYVNGSNLQSDLIVTPPTDFEVSLASGSGYQSTPLTLTQTGGVINNVPVYVRLKAGLATGSYSNENLACSTTGAATVNVTASGTVTDPTYCTCVGDNSIYSLTRVKLNTLDNNTAKPGPYSDYTALSTNLYLGNSYAFTANINTSGGNIVYAAVYIDWNYDGDFNDAGESYNLGSSTVAGITSLSPLSITVPVNASLGTTRMRVASNYYNPVYGPCSNENGEVEDYTLNILSPAISVSTASLSGFSYVSGSGPSANQSFNVSGAGIASAITVTPPTDFEISASAGGPYQSTALSINAAGGVVSNVPIYVRLKAGLAAGSYSLENLSLASTAATTQNVTLSGSVTIPKTYYSIASGDWLTNTTWSYTSGGAAVPVGNYPVAGDLVNIANGHTLTVSSSGACGSLTFTGANGTLSINAGVTLAVAGAVTLNSCNTTSGYSTACTITGQGTLTSGSVQVGTDFGVTVNGTYPTTVTSTIAQWNISGNLNLSSFVGTTTARIINSVFNFGSGTINLDGALTTTNENGVNTTTFAMNTGSQSGNLALSNATPLSIAGTGTTTLNFNGNTSLVNYDGTAQAVYGTSYHDLTLSGSGTKTLGAALTTNGALTLGSGVTLSIGANSMTLYGDLLNNGGTTTGSGAVVLTGTANQSIGAFSTTGTVSMTKTGGTATLTGNIAGGALTTNGLGGTLHLGSNLSHIFTGTWTRTNGTLNGGTSILSISSITNATGTFTAANGTIDFTGTTTVPLLNYYNLSFSGVTTKTIATGVTLPIANNWIVNSPVTMTTTAGANVAGSISGTGNITVGSGTLTIGGDFSNSGSFTWGTGTVNYNGVNQQVKSTTYNNLISSGGGIKTLAVNVTVNLTTTLTSGVLELGNYNLTIAATTSLAITGSTFGSTNMIGTNGTGYLIRTTANGINNYTFPIGSSGYYSPFSTTSVTGSFGTISARAVSSAALGAGFITKYWDLLTNTAGKTITATFAFDPAEGSNPFEVWYKAGAAAWQTPPPAGTASFATNSMTITGLTSLALTSTWWSAGVRQQYYAYKTGSWNDPTTWTSDPSGTTQVGTTVPGYNDVVEILSGKTVTLPANITFGSMDLTLDEGGVLDMSTYQFSAGLKSLSGQGTLKLSSASFPTVTTNNFVLTGGGTTEYNLGINLPTAQTQYNHLTINAPSQSVVQTSNLVLNGNLSVKNGTFQLNDATSRRLWLTVNGDLTVDVGGSFKVGTGVTNTTIDPSAINGGTAPFLTYYDGQSHRIVLNGNLTNNGIVRFTNLLNPVFNAFPPTTLGATSGFATVYFQGASDNTVYCNGTTDFYNLVIDKGIDQTFKLTVYSSSSAYSNFRLFGANTAIGTDATANPGIRKALWIRTGTLVLQGLVVIPSLTEGATAGSPNSDYFIPANGALVLDGIDVVVQTTADDYREINAAYGTTLASNAAAGIAFGGTGSALDLYGLLQINLGFLSTKESAGILTSSTSPGALVINNGTLDTKQFLAQTGAASFQQNGGLFLLRGRFQRTPSSYTSALDLANAPLNTARSNDAILTSTAGTFNLNTTNNVFNMTGGTLRIFDVCSAASPAYALQVNSSVNNINVSGGTIEFAPTAGTGGSADVAIHLCSINGPLSNVTVNRASSTTAVQLSNALVVQKDLNLLSGMLNANNQDITIGGNFTLSSGTTYTSGTNTTAFNGSDDQL
ncbi:MAG: GEVED domain-containing protein, partial [Marinilabiliales bacterium]|nr:GEVED domain-containing protein [Marinilabiliales bacterium]